MRLRHAVLLATTIFFAAACASSSGPRRSSAGSDTITLLEIRENANATTAYDLVNRLRPRWLQPARTTSSISGGVVRQPVTLVYLDGSRLGGIESLRSISTFNIQSIQWLDEQRAATVLRDVPNQPINGAIVIVTRTQ